MHCTWVQRHAMAICEGTLPEAEKSELETHIRNCTRCQSAVARVAELLDEMDSAETPELSARFWPELHRRLQAHDAARAVAGKQWVSWRKRLQPVLACVCLLVGMLAGIHLGNAYARRVFMPVTEISAVPKEPVFYSEILEGLPPGSLSGLYILDSGNEEPGRSK